MTLPRNYRSGIGAGIVEGSWNPDTQANDLAVRVDAAQLHFTYVRNLPKFHEAAYIPDALCHPDAVFRMTDGDFLYCKRTAEGGNVVFTVRVRPTGALAYVWGFERCDPADPCTPLAKDQDRAEQRLK